MEKTTKNKILLYTSISVIAFYIYFNRNSYREIQTGIVSPTDGTIESIQNNRIVSMQSVDIA